VLKSGHEVTEEELIIFCKERIARYKSPKCIDFLPALRRRVGKDREEKTAGTVPAGQGEKSP